MLWIFNVLGTPDRKAINEWVSAYGDEKRLAEFEAGLATLHSQECYVWAPRSRIFEKVRVRDFRTLHPDRTHLRRAGLLDTKPVVSDIPALIERLSHEMAKVKDEKVATAEVPALRAQVRRLQEQLAARPAHAAAAPGPTNEEIERVRVAPLREKVRALLVEAKARQGELVARDRWIAKVKRGQSDLADLIASAPEPAPDGPLLSWAMGGPKPPAQVPPARALGTYSDDLVKRAPATSLVTGVAGEDATPDQGSMGRGERKILTVLARRPEEWMSRGKVGLMADFSVKSGTFDTYMGRLKKRGYLESANGSARATPDGVAAIGPIPAVPQTHAELMAEWGSSIGTGPRMLLETLDRQYPGGLTRQDLAAQANFSWNSGTFDTYVGRLRTLGLIEKQGDVLVVSKYLYPE
jgi:hypothetical protein